jgi:hypothetical protein
MRERLKMHADKIILLDSILPILLYGVTLIIVSFLKDSPGPESYLGPALLFIFVMALFGLVAIVVTIVNISLIKHASTPGIKLLAFAPIFVCVVHVVYVSGAAHSVVDLVSRIISKEESATKQSHTLTVEIRSPRELSSSFNFWLKTSRREIRPYPVDQLITTGDQYIHRFFFPLFSERDRSRYLQIKDAPGFFYLDIDKKPKTFPYTNWEKFLDLKVNKQDSVKLEIRYKVIEGTGNEMIP